MKKLALLMAVMTSCAFGQGVFFNGNNTTSAKNVPPGAQAPVLTLPSSKVTVCGYPAIPEDNSATCTNTVQIFSDQILQHAITQPLTSDSQGRFGFWISPGTYSYSITTAGGSFVGTFPLSLTAGPQGVPGPAGVGCVPGNCVVTSPAGSQTVTQPVNTNFNVVTSGSGNLQHNGSAVIDSVTPAQTISGTLTTNGYCINSKGPYDARVCGNAKGDTAFPQCSINAGFAILTCSTGPTPFTVADVGKEMYVQGAGVSGATLQTSIAGFTDTTHVTLGSPASTTVSNATGMYGTDDTAALQAAFNTASFFSRPLYIPYGQYLHHGLKFTQSAITIYGDGRQHTFLRAMAVTNPGRINTISSVGIDISGTGNNTLRDMAIFTGNNGLFADIAPNINLYAARIGGTGVDFGIIHNIRDVWFQTGGPYNVYLYGYEQTTFEDCVFESFANPSLGNVTFAAQNTAGRASPYFNTLAAPVSMTKVSIYGAKTTFSGIGKMVVFDQGGAQGNYSISIRDAFIVMNGANGSFVSDTGGSPLKQLEFRTDYAEMNTCVTCKMFDISAPAWDWSMTNIQSYNTVGSFTSPQFNFANGILDSDLQIDQAGSVGGISLNASSCQGSTLHLGQPQPTANCTDWAMLTGVAVQSKFNNGITTTIVTGACTMNFIGGVLNSKSGC